MYKNGARVGVILILLLIILYPGLEDIATALINTADSLNPAQSTVGYAFIHAFPILILVLFGGIATWLIIRASLRRRE